METMAQSRKSVEELFEAALARSPKERTAFLDEECPDSPDVRKIVELLLDADVQAGSFLQTPLLSATDSSNSRPSATFEPGYVACERFQIHRFIARGGMGEVYEAWDMELRERVAIKTIRPELARSEEILERFRREVKQARSISHPNICRIHELFCDHPTLDTNVWFLSMEFLDGSTLSEHIAHLGPMKPAVALDIVEQIASGLTAAHSTGVIHRDLKSGNVMLVSGAAGQLRAVITDFGLAFNVLHRDGNISEPGGQGTPEYMAPEQRKTGEVSALADQYALGVIMCEMLTGSRPTKSDVTTARTQLQSRLANCAGPRWSRVVLRCLEQEPQKRFNDVSDIVAEVKPVEGSKHRWGWIAFAGALAMLVAFGLWYRIRPSPPPTSLAVLPLENHTGNSSFDYVVAGITEALTDDLSRMHGLQVTAGSVARRYQGVDADPRSAGGQMHVGSIVSGALNSSGGKLQIPIELIRVGSGKQIWGQTYEGTVSDLADMQHEIATDVAYHLKIQLGTDTAARLNRQYSTNPAAYDAYLKGRFQLAKRSPDSLREAVSEFQRALTFDPHYAPALAGLADSYSLLAFFGLEPSIPLLRNALKTSQEALEIDSTSAEAYTSRAFARTLLNFDWEGAEADYKRAIELNPNYALAHAWYAIDLLTPLGREAEARAQMKYVETSDPESPLGLVGIAMIDDFFGHPEQAIRLLGPWVNASHTLEPAIERLSESYLHAHKGKRAIELLRSMPVAAEDADSRAAYLAIAYAETGETAKAAETARQLEAKVHTGKQVAYPTAELFTVLGNHEKAIEMLQTAFNTRDSGLLFVNADPPFAPLRGDQQFQRLLQQMNLQ